MRLAWALLFGLAAGAAGCRAADQNIPDGFVVDPNAGVLVVRLRSNWPASGAAAAGGLELSYHRRAPYMDRHRLVSGAPDDVKILALTAGLYVWDEVVTPAGRWPIPAWLGFTIQPGRITYIGDLEVELDDPARPGAAAVRVFDGGDELLPRLRATHPRLFSTYRYEKVLPQPR